MSLSLSCLLYAIRFSLTLSFRTRLLNTVVVYGSAVSDDRRFFSVTIESGVIVFRIDTRMAVEDSVTRVAMPAGDSFSDGMWHTVRVQGTHKMQYACSCTCSVEVVV